MVTSWTWLSRKRRGRDADELGALGELGEIAGAGIAHGGAQAADQLVQHARERTLIGHLPLDPFRHELQRVLDVLLEIAVGRAARHGADRAHAAIGLIGAALVQIDLAWALVGAGEQRADHHAIGAGGERLGEIAGIFDAAVRDHRHVVLLRHLDRLEQRRELRHADAGHDARGADRARPDADLHASAPASISAMAPSRVATLPAATCTALDSRLILPMASSTRA